MRLLVILCAVTLTSCVPAGKVQVVKQPEQKFSLSEQQGVVIARVINASPYSQTFNFLTLSPKNVYEAEENKFKRLESIMEMPGGTTIFAGPLPAGDYSLSDVYSYHYFYNYYYQFYGSANPKFGTFKIAPGKVTNLGTIIYYQKPDGDRYHALLARKDEFKDGLEYLKKSNQGLYDQLDRVTTLAWDEDDYAAERHNLYLNIVQNPVTFDNAYPQEDGSWCFTGKLGTILNRTAEGGWEIDALDTDYNLIAFNRNSAGDKISVDETNTIYFKRNNDAQWKTISGPDVEGRLAHVQLGVNGDVYTIHMLKHRLEVHAGVLSDQPNWQRKQVYHPKLGWITPEQYDKTAVKLPKYGKQSKIENFNAVMNKGSTLVSSNGKLFELNLSKGQVTKIATDFSVVNMSRNSYDQLSIAKISAWDGQPVRQYTLDGGKSWNSFSNKVDNCPNENKNKSINKCNDTRKSKFTNRPISTPVFFADGAGYSIVRETTTEGGFFTPLKRTTTYSLVVSSNNGKTWSVSTADELPKYCGGLRKGHDETTLLLSCENTTGMFYTANKDELKWRVDYQPALF